MVQFGELIGSLHRLAFIRDRLNELELDDLEAAVATAELLIEGFHLRLFMLRERAVAVVETFAEFSKRARKKKKLINQEPEAYALVEAKSPQVMSAFESLRDAINRADCGVRNNITHERYLHLEFDGCDALDLLAEVRGTDREASVEADMRSAFTDLADKYDGEIAAVLAAATVLIETIDAANAELE